MAALSANHILRRKAWNVSLRLVREPLNVERMAL
jgi:hypothetical protein